MLASVRAMFSGIVDYAGMFPPAQLPLEQAIRNYARYRTEPESWMLGRFVCPAARLEELAGFIEPLTDAVRLPVAVLGTSVPTAGGSKSGLSPDLELVHRHYGKTAVGFLWGLNPDLELMHRFESRYSKHASLDVYEVRLPEDLLDPNLHRRSREGAPYDFLDYVAVIVDQWHIRSFSPCFEIVLDHDWRTSVPAQIAVVANVNSARLVSNRPGWNPGSLKIRCGGQEAGTTPSSEQLALVMSSCRAVRLPLKFTAGLHHPFRGLDASTRVPRHGFINVFGAGILAYSRRIREDRIREILEDEEAGDFRFDEAGFSWKELRATVAEINVARQEAVTSFGSCSFDEPREGLRALRLIS